MPKVKLFKRSSQEPEWYWQSVEVPNYYRNIGDKVRSVQIDKHKFLNIEQVATINAWLQHLPDPEGLHLIADQDEDNLDISVTSTGSNERYRHHQRQRERERQRERAHSLSAVTRGSSMNLKTFI